MFQRFGQPRRPSSTIRTRLPSYSYQDWRPRYLYEVVTIHHSKYSSTTETKLRIGSSDRDRVLHDHAPRVRTCIHIRIMPIPGVHSHAGGVELAKPIRHHQNNAPTAAYSTSPTLPPFFSFFDLLTLNLGTAVVPKTTLTSAVLVFIPYCISQTHVSPRSLGHFSLDSIRINNNKGGLMIIFSTALLPEEGLVYDISSAQFHYTHVHTH